MTRPASSLRVLWAKTARKGTQPVDAYHPLICHMIDVGSVALSFLEQPEAAHLRKLLAGLLGTAVDQVPRLVAFLAALHDLPGKASPSFQCKSPDHWARVRAAGLSPGPSLVPRFDHARESYLALRHLIAQSGVLDLPTIRRGTHPALETLALAVGAHHGELFDHTQHDHYPEVASEEDPRRPVQAWQEPWRGIRRALVEEARLVFLGEDYPIPVRPVNLSALCVVLGGLVILADWLGSGDTMCTFHAGPLPDYPEGARARARETLAGRSLLNYLLEPSAPPTFADVSTEAPRPLQAALEPAALPELPAQALVVVEAPTGEGKTEAALLLAHRLATSGGSRGFYVALPTVATSNQMYGRVDKALGLFRSRHGGEHSPTLMLVNGQAEFSEEFAKALARGHEGGSNPTDPTEDSTVADEWLLPRKLSLLSPYGVGTIDQVLFAALNVRHVALRLFGLAGKVVVVDEVHAYDVFMSEVLKRLLEWLHAIGASVVLLSATLPRARRAELIAAFGGHQEVPNTADEPDPYPLVTIVDGKRPEATPIALTPESGQAPRTILIERRTDGEEERPANARYLLDLVGARGCVCWLVNTVREAQACYLALKRQLRDVPRRRRPKLVLFHARAPLRRRKRVERFVVRRLGRKGNRSRPVIVIATQVVEQSLDLDFDLLMTQLAPIDLLIQRLGRLHRHAGNDGQRPRRLRQPRLVLLMPPSEFGRPAFGGSGIVYSPFILLKTLVALHGCDSLSVPREVRNLIEQVYDGELPTEQAARRAGLTLEQFVEEQARLKDKQRNEEQQAVQYLLNPPFPGGGFHLRQARPVDDEAAEREGWVAAKTRLAEPSVRVVLLERGNPLAEVLIRERRLTPEQTRAALLHAVSISDWGLVQHVRVGDSGVVSLDRFRGLRGHFMLPLDQGQYAWPEGAPRHRLTLSRKLGVRLERLDASRAGGRGSAKL